MEEEGVLFVQPSLTITDRVLGEEPVYHVSHPKRTSARKPARSKLVRLFHMRKSVNHALVWIVVDSSSRLGGASGRLVRQ